MTELALRGKSIVITGNNVVNDIKTLYPELFPYQSVEELSLLFPYDIQVSLVSFDGTDSDYKRVTQNINFFSSNVSISNIKIKSEIDQTGYIYTAGI